MELKSLPVGARLEDQSGSFRYYVAAQNHPGYAGTTLLSAQVVLVGPLDAAEPESVYGSNNLAHSNLLQWLCSETDDWFVPQHSHDMPPISQNIRHEARGYTQTPGYLGTLPPAVRENLLESRVPVHCLKQDGTPGICEVSAKVFLPSRTEMAMGDDYGLPEGSPLPLLRDIRFRQAVLTQQAAEGYRGPWQPAFPMRAGGIWRYWLRSPHLRYGYLCRYVGEMGGLSFAPAYYEIIGCRPMMNVRETIRVQRGEGPGNVYYIEEGN